MFWGTPALQFVPWWAWAWETLIDGHLPLWNPLVGMGAPLIANYQSALFYPPYWCYFIFYVIGGIKAMAWAQGLLVTLHIIWAGLGMTKLIRRNGFGQLSQTIGGLAFSLSGYLVARAWFASINASVAWLPWVMLMAFDAVRQPKKLNIWLKLAIVIAFQLLSGHAQTTWYTLLLAGLWVGFLTFKASIHENFGDGLRAFLHSELKFALAVVAGLALAAVQLLPTFVYLQQSQRASAVEMEFALTYSLWPWRLLEIFAPGLFGSPARGDFWGYGNYWEDALYIGLLPALLALMSIIGVFFARRGNNTGRKARSIDVDQRSISTFLVIIFAVSILLALGKNTPIYPWLYQHVPTFDMFQAPTRISIWAVFSLSLLAAIRVDVWHKPEGRGLYWTRLATAGAFAISLGAGLAFWGMGDVKATFIRAAALAGLWGFGTGVLSLMAPGIGKDSLRIDVWRWVVIAWLGADLIVAGWGLVPGISADFYDFTDLQDANVASRIYLSPTEEDELKYAHFLSFDSFQKGLDWDEMRNALLPNLNMLTGVASTNNFDPMVPGRYQIWMDSLGEVDEAKRKRLLQLMGVSTIVKLENDESFDIRFESLKGGARVRWVPCAISAKDQGDAWVRIFKDQFDPQVEVIIEGLEPTKLQDCSQSTSKFTIISENTNQIVIKLETNTSGWLVVPDVNYPGWIAKVDGQLEPILQANYLFRAVPVEPGTHQVEFIYRPLEFAIGIFVTILSWIVIIALYFKKYNSLL